MLPGPDGHPCLPYTAGAAGPAVSRCETPLLRNRSLFLFGRVWPPPCVVALVVAQDRAELPRNSIRSSQRGWSALVFAARDYPMAELHLRQPRRALCAALPHEGIPASISPFNRVVVR